MFESLVSVEKLRSNMSYALLLGMFYSSVSIAVSLYIFPKDFIVFAVALTSLLFLPTINKLLEQEKDEELKKDWFRIRNVFQKHEDAFKIYIFIFFGIMIAFIFFSFMVSDAMLGSLLENRNDVSLSSFQGTPSFESYDFVTIFGHNIKVIVVCYLAAYFFGTGAIFIISWNASLWGITFGAITRNAMHLTSVNMYSFFILMALAILPYMLIEASAYFMCGISGGIVSMASKTERKKHRKMELVFKNSLIILWASILILMVGSFLESTVTPYILKMLF